MRFLIVYLLNWWGSALVAMVGIWFLKRDWAGPAGGVFLAAGLVVAIGTTGEVLVTAPHFGRWQTDVSWRLRRWKRSFCHRCDRGRLQGPDPGIVAARCGRRSLGRRRPRARPHQCARRCGLEAEVSHRLGDGHAASAPSAQEVALSRKEIIVA